MKQSLIDDYIVLVESHRDTETQKYRGPNYPRIAKLLEGPIAYSDPISMSGELKTRASSSSNGIFE